jgi:anti-sigma factor RsiW
MSHLAYKSSQTAALYVADGLPDPDREAFELHLMNCSECIEDVETWRALADGIAAERPAAAVEARPVAVAVPSPPTSPTQPPQPALPRVAARARPAWAVAASVLMASALGLLCGRFLGDRAPSIGDPSLAFVSLGAPTRAGDCAVVRIAADARVVAIRIPGALEQTTLVATRVGGSALDRDRYSVRTQADGSWLVRLPVAALVGQEIELETRSAQAGEPARPVGCVSAIAVP